MENCATYINRPCMSGSGLHHQVPSSHAEAGCCCSCTTTSRLQTTRSKRSSALYSTCNCGSPAKSSDDADNDPCSSKYATVSSDASRSYEILVRKLVAYIGGIQGEVNMPHAPEERARKMGTNATRLCLLGIPVAFPEVYES